MKNKDCIIKGGSILTPAGFLEDGVVLSEGGRISYVGPENNLPAVGREALQVDARGMWVVPGFVDIHVHGGNGYDTMDASWEALNEMSKSHARFGTTSFLPTTVTAPQQDLKRAAVACAAAMEKGTEGAEVIGLHLEGPFINPVQKGAQNAAHVRLPSVEELSELNDLAGGAVRLVSLAPEMPGALEAVSWLVEKGITASVGHSGAKYEDVARAVAFGLSHGTHTFNGMVGLHHREPGTAGAILSLNALTAEVIADLIHVHPAVIRILVSAKGIDKVVLVTDAIRAMGMPDGEYDLGGLAVRVEDGVARLKEGNLAGSTLNMTKAVKNMVEHVGIPLADAVKMATANPARTVGMAGCKGSITVGKDADMVVLNSSLEVVVTIVKGKVVYSQ